jgi:hypothetical protein
VAILAYAWQELDRRHRVSDELRKQPAPCEKIRDRILDTSSVFSSRLSTSYCAPKFQSTKQGKSHMPHSSTKVLSSSRPKVSASGGLDKVVQQQRFCLFANK